MSFFPTQTEVSAVIQKQPERFKDGLMWMDPGDVWLYLVVYLACTGFFFLVAFVMDKLFLKFQYSQYMKRNDAAKVRFLEGCVEMTHHLIVIFVSAYIQFYACSNMSGEPWPSAEGGTYSKPGAVKHWGWWKDDVCFFQFSKGFAYSLLFTNGYLSCDFIIHRFWFIDRKPLDKQIEIHHIIASMGYTGALVAGYGYGGVSVASQLCEVSNIFLVFKEMFSTPENRNSTLHIVNQVLFFISYIVFRMYLFPILVYRTFYMTLATFQIVNWARKIIEIIITILAVLVTLLNFYWFKLILKGLKKMLQEKGILEKKDGDDYTQLDDYEVENFDEGQKEEQK